MNKETLLKELNFTATRSSGSGGQHINKVSSKIVLRFNLEKSTSFLADEKELLFKNLAKKLTKENELIITCSKSRSQHKNKELVIAKFLTLLSDCLKVKKSRKATKPSKQVQRKRLEKKAKHALKKANRKKPDYY